MLIEVEVQESTGIRPRHVGDPLGRVSPLWKVNDWLSTEVTWSVNRRVSLLDVCQLDHVKGECMLDGCVRFVYLLDLRCGSIYMDRLAVEWRSATWHILNGWMEYTFVPSFRKPHFFISSTLFLLLPLCQKRVYTTPHSPTFFL